MTAKGTKNPHRGKGAAAKFLRDNLAYDGEDCLLWPFGRQPTGYGSLGYMGVQYYAHRFMCELVHGPAPSPEHEAAHSCGRGKQGCVDPRHLSWKTKAQNMQDKRQHGTASNSWWGRRGKLTPEIVQQIRDGIPYGPPLIHWLSAKYGITPSNIRHIQQGRTWASKHPRKFLTPEQIAIIRSPDETRNEFELAAEFGFSRSAINRVRLGKSYRRSDEMAA